MSDNALDLAYSFLEQGIGFWEARSKGERIELIRVQNALKALLEREELREWDVQHGAPTITEIRDVDFRPAEIAGQRFLGCRYLLACWIDELMTRQTTNTDAWVRDWDNRKLETFFYANNDRSTAIPHQAQWILQQEGYEQVLQLYYLCVMLGFRGQWEAQLLQDWVNRARSRIIRYIESDPLVVSATEPPPARVPPLLGQDKMERMGLMFGYSLVLFLILCVVYWVVLVSPQLD